MIHAVLVVTGGGLGALTRYLVSLWLARVNGAHFPLGTFVCNVVGSFLLVLLYQLGGERLSVDARLFLGTGCLGGFTTYSTFNLELLSALQAGAYTLAILYLVLTVLGGLVGGLGAIWMAHLLSG